MIDGLCQILIHLIAAAAFTAILISFVSVLVIFIAAFYFDQPQNIWSMGI